MNKIHIHWKLDFIYVAMFFTIGSLYVYMVSNALSEPPQKLIYNTITFRCSDWFSCLMLSLFYITIIVGTIVCLNFGFRVFEYSEYGFCMRSMFSRRCYQWSDVEEIYASTKFGARWVIFSTRDGNFYGCPYHPKVVEILKKKTQKNVITVYDPYSVVKPLRERRRKHKQKMMFFQP